MIGSRVPWQTIAGLVAGGWQPFPLPARQKFPPPPGVTGRNAQPLPPTDLYQLWTDGRFANIATRLPPGVIGIDVDAYGDRSTDAWTELAQHLDPTWIVRNRPGDPISGTRLFRHDPHPDVAYKGATGCIDTLHAGHRYQVLPPSEHPDGHRRYYLTDPEGLTGAPMPHVDELPTLPASAVWHLCKQAPPPEKMLPPPTAEQLHRGHTQDYCRRVLRILDGMATTGSRHVAYNSRLCALWTANAQGHRGALDAIHRLAQQWMQQMAEARGEHTARQEWMRMSNSARARYGHPTGEQCRCPW